MRISLDIRRRAKAGRYCIVCADYSIFFNVLGVRVAQPQHQEESFDMPMTGKKKKKRAVKKTAAKGAAKKTKKRKKKK
jgi:hypothetical protein